MESICGVVATALFCGGVAFSGYSNALADELKAYTEEEKNIHEIIRNGGETPHFTVDAELVEKDGETVMYEVNHPFEKPDKFPADPWKVFPQDINNDGENDSVLEVYVNRQDTDELLILFKIDDTLAAYYYRDRQTGVKYGGRGSLHPDGNYEQEQKGETTGDMQFLINNEDYLD